MALSVSDCWLILDHNTLRSTTRGSSGWIPSPELVALTLGRQALRKGEGITIREPLVSFPFSSFVSPKQKGKGKDMSVSDRWLIQTRHDAPTRKKKPRRMSCQGINQSLTLNSRLPWTNLYRKRNEIWPGKP